MKNFWLFILFILLSNFQSLHAQDESYGTQITGSPVIEITTGQLMEHWMPIVPAELKRRNIGLGLKEPDRENLPQSPGALELSQWPPLDQQNLPENLNEIDAPQTYGISFTGAVFSDALAFPPDVMGAAGPTQYIVFINGRLRSFNKTTGTADGVLNIDPDVFFSTITTPPSSGEVTYTTDPNVRYDRLSGRWFLSIVDVTLNSTSGAITRPNRMLFAVSDGSIITNSTVWRLIYFQGTGNFDDYPSLGIDADGIYVGTNRFTIAGAFVNCRAYVFRKATFISGTPTGTIFDNILVSNAGPFSPRGVDNSDPLNTGATATGYFIGVDGATYSTLMLRRITNPGGTPTISSNISLTVNTTRGPITVRHSGNTGGSNGYLDALDDRLFIAQIRNGRLWTAHNVGVRNNGVSSIISNSRNAARWYELTNLSGTPSLFQSGTLYDNSSTATNLNQRNYWIPAITVSGQGHAVLGCSIAGTNERINAFTTGRLSADALGTLRNGPGGSSIPGYTSSTTAYNPASDPGGTNGRRWGDYSFTCVDPNDDMTMWTAQQFCDAANSWGVRVLQLIAPPPAIPISCSPGQVQTEQTIDIVVTGSSVSGSGFFDPGNDAGGPGFLNRIAASMPNVTVNSVTYNNPTQVTLNITIGNIPSGIYDVTITNPDGQFLTGTGILEIENPLPVELSSFTSKIIGKSVILNWQTATEVNNYGFEIQKSVVGSQKSEWNAIGFINGSGNSNSQKSYSYEDKNLSAGKYSYRLKQIDNDGKFEYSKAIEVDLSVLLKFELSQNFPNPFNPGTKISWQSPVGSWQSLKVFDLLGNEVVTLVDEYREAGKYEINFDASRLSSGIYIYKLQTSDFLQVRKMTLVK